VNSKYQLASYILWVAHPVLQAAVAGFMFRRKYHRTFPYFFAYLVAQLVSFAVVFPIYVSRSYFFFFYAYWASAALGVGLGFKVIHEVFVDIFRPYHTLKDLGSVLFKWSGLVMVLVAGVVSASTPTTEQGPIVQGIMALQRSVRVVQCGLVLFLLVFSSYLGIHWKQRSFGIALGFGIFAAVELGLGALNMSGLVRLNPLSVGLLNMIAYNSAIVVWLAYAMMRSPAREISANLLRSQRWEQSLTDLQHPVPADSLIPMFEGMVDRAFSKTTQYSIEHSRTAVDEAMTSAASEYSEEIAISPVLTNSSRTG
jgi:hypothetical protein